MSRQVRRERYTIETPATKDFNPPKTYRRRAPRFFRAIIYLGLILSIALAGYAIFGYRVGSITVDEPTLAPQIEQTAREVFSEDWFGNRILFLNKAKIITTITNEYPAEVSEVSLGLNYVTRQLTIRVARRQAHLLWQSKGSEYLVDQDGIVLEKRGSGGPRLPVVIDQSNLPVRVGSPIVSNRFISFVDSLVIELPKKTGLKLTRLRIEDTANELLADTKSGYYVRLDISQDLGSQLDNLKQVLRDAKRRGQSIEQYVDVRIPHKAYYR